MANIIYRELEIRFPNGDNETIKGNNIIAESMSITRSICDGNLKLGGCIATLFEIQFTGIRPDAVQGKKIQAVLLEYSDEHFEVLYPSDTLIPSDNLIPDGRYSYNCTERVIFTGYIDTARREKNRQIVSVTAFDDLVPDGRLTYNCTERIIFTGYVDRAARQKNRQIVNITAYDDLYRLGCQNVAQANPNGMQWILRWQTSAENNNYTRPLSLSKNLVETLYKGDILAVDILKAANELMGLFGYITPEGKYTTMSIVEELPVTISRWIDLEFEEYNTEQIDIVSFDYYDSRKMIFGRSSSTNSCYYSDDNILTRCSTNYDNVKNLIKNVANAGKLTVGNINNVGYKYRPFKLTTIDKLLPSGVGLGSRVHIATGESDMPWVNSFVFQEKITGIQSLKYELSAEGDRILSGYDNLSEVVTS